jgi:pSer/pThr/pTyr-binding forkhead associated (FHA) protein
MEAANLNKDPPPSATTRPGELILQNGRQAGARRPLCSPITFIGRTQDCDIRLNVDGVDPLHCLVVLGPDGVRLRDLNNVHGTFVNGVRAENTLLRHGDLLKIGPFQFRVELNLAPSCPAEIDENSLKEHREAVRIQAAAIAAQQAALEEEETRLAQRRSDLQQQEEQLAARLAEKQRQVQLWSEYTHAEREALRKEKIDQETLRAKLDQELLQAKQELSADHDKLAQERQRINNVYQRLRQRWQRQWSAEKEKYRNQALKLQADAMTLHERQNALLAKEASLKQDILHFNAQRELGARQLQEGRAALKTAQEGWRRRRSREILVLKGMRRQADGALIKLKQARRLLVEEKQAWDKQFDFLQKELHGLNNRILHQRLRVQEQTEEIARLDALLRNRQLQINQLPKLATEIASSEIEPQMNTDEHRGEIWAHLGSSVLICGQPPAPATDPQRRFDGLDHMASELADQRAHLIEQYQRLAEIQDVWQRQRDQAAAELETLAHRLLAREQSLDQRDQQTAALEATNQQRQQEIDTIRHEIQLCRAQLTTRAQIFEKDHQEQMLALRQKETQLQEQLAGLEQLRNRWNQRRQQTIDQLRSKRAALEEQHKETHKRRVALFERNQQIEEEKRIFADKALALEQYRQEVFCRAKDAAAQRRVERLRRRWLTLNAALIRTAKAEREAARKDLLELDSQRAELMNSMNQLAQDESVAAEKQALLEEGEAVFKSRQLELEEQVGKLESQRQHSQEKSLRLQDEIDALAKAVYEEADAPAVAKAA